MSQQLILALEPDSLDAETELNFRWCWLSEGRALREGFGGLQDFAQLLDAATQQIWLLLPGNRVVLRELEYSEKEKRHLRNLLPYQLEDSVIGDVEDFHFALGDARDGKVTLAYTDKLWLKELFEKISDLGVEISRCLVLPQLLHSFTSAAHEPLFSSADSATLNDSASLTPTQHWQLAMHQGLVNVVIPNLSEFSVPLEHLSMALELAVQEQKLQTQLPDLYLRAEEEADLANLIQAIPQSLKNHIRARELVSLWQLDFSANAINLCQAEFSQRLPLERWWKQWKAILMFALITLVVYVSVLSLEIFKANKNNLYLRQQIESTSRQVLPAGRAEDPEQQLRIKWAQLQPKSQGVSAVSMLASALPVIASNSDISLRVLSYSSETGEMNISLQAHSFSSIDALRQSLTAQGFAAEILSANAQGDANTARIKISKP